LLRNANCQPHYLEEEHHVPRKDHLINQVSREGKLGRISGMGQKEGSKLQREEGPLTGGRELGQTEARDREI